MLLTMRALTEAMRALAYSEAVTMDLAHYGAADERDQQQARIDLMIPVIKGWMTEAGVELTSLGCRFTAAWDTSRKPAPRSTGAMCGSRRSTRVPTVSRPRISWGASSGVTAARRWRR
jgi:alkylation response protein AidB-like acyl-CoA dehydrogenase